MSDLCPTCGRAGYLSHIDLRNATQHYQCRRCGRSWTDAIRSSDEQSETPASTPGRYTITGMMQRTPESGAATPAARAAREAKVVIRRAGAGKVRFALLAPNGKVIASSRPYESKGAAMKDIELLREHAADAVLEDQTTETATSTERPLRSDR